MGRRSKLLLDGMMIRAPFEIRRHLREITLEPLSLVFSAFEAGRKEITILQVGA